MDVRQLSYFVAVADHGTVTAAAAALHLSQPPLSTQIQQLEQELGCRLFERFPRHMVLTDAGRTLYARARAILDLCASAEGEMADLRAGTAGTLRIGAVSSVAETLVSVWLRKFCEGRRDLRFELHEANTFQLLEKLRSGDLELAFVRRPFSAPDLECASIRSEPFCAVGLPEFFPAESGATITLRQAAAAPLLFYRRWEETLAERFREEDLHPRVVCVSDDARTVVSMAEAGMGLGIVPQSAVPERDAALARVIGEECLRSEICAVCRKDVYVSAAARQLFQSVRAVRPRDAKKS